MSRTVLNALSALSHLMVTTNAWSQAVLSRRTRAGRAEVPLSRLLGWLSTLLQKKSRLRLNGFSWSFFSNTNSKTNISVLSPIRQYRGGWENRLLRILNCSHFIAYHYTPKGRRQSSLWCNWNKGGRENHLVPFFRKLLINVCTRKTCGVSCQSISHLRSIKAFLWGPTKGHQSTVVKLFTSISALQSFRYPAPNMIQKHRSTQSDTLFSHSVVSDSLRPHGLQHARLHCPSPSPRVCSNSCPLSRWHPPTISSSVVPLSSCFQSFPASGSLLMSRLFISVGQSLGTSALASVLPMNIQDYFL